jgi:hypothetical protein
MGFGTAIPAAVVGFLMAWQAILRIKDGDPTDAPIEAKQR